MVKHMSSVHKAPSSMSSCANNPEHTIKHFAILRCIETVTLLEISKLSFPLPFPWHQSFASSELQCTHRIVALQSEVLSPGSLHSPVKDVAYTYRVKSHHLLVGCEVCNAPESEPVTWEWPLLDIFSFISLFQFTDGFLSTYSSTHRPLGLKIKR